MGTSLPGLVAFSNAGPWTATTNTWYMFWFLTSIGNLRRRLVFGVSMETESTLKHQPALQKVALAWWISTGGDMVTFTNVFVYNSNLEKYKRGLMLHFSYSSSMLSFFLIVNKCTKGPCSIYLAFIANQDLHPWAHIYNCVDFS